MASRPEAVRTRQAAGTKSLVARFARTDQRINGTGCLRILNRQQPRKALKEA